MSARRWLLIVLCVLLVFTYARAQVCPPSATNSILNAPASTVLTDNNGNGWGIPVSGGYVLFKSTTLHWTSGAIALAYVNGVMWYKNNSQQWYSFTSTGAIASGPQSTPPTNIGESITINSIGTQTASTSFVVSGSIINATSTPVLNYSVNSGNYIALPGGSTVTNTGSGAYTFSFTEPGMAQATSNTISVQDTNNGTVGTSNAFAVNGSGPTLSGTPMSPLPSGYLHVLGNQIQDGSGNNVRLSCSGYNIPTGNYGSDMSIMRSQGFNCARYDLYEAQICPSVFSGGNYIPGTCSFTTLDPIVSAATANNMKIVLDMHASESGCSGTQPSGIWYDINSPTVVGGVAWNTLVANGDGCAAGTGTGAFHVSNGQIVGPNGKSWIGAGVDVHDGNLGAAASGTYQVTSTFPGLNIVRVYVGGYGTGGTNNNYPAPSTYATAVTTLTNAGIVVEFHNASNSNNTGCG